MNIFNKALAAGVTLALASVSAHAQLAAPGINETSAPGSQGLYLAVWNASTSTSEVVNLSYPYSSITTASGNLTPTAANSAFKLATDPSGAAGQVLQLNFGQVAGFTAAGGNIFGGSSVANDSYMVLSALSGTGGGMTITDTTTPIVTSSSITGAIGNINSEIAAWVSAAPTTGDLIDTTGTATYSVTNQRPGGLNTGAVIAGFNYSQSVGSAIGFYNVVSTGRTSVSINGYANANGSGSWFLSNTGDLTYNIASGPSTAPVPIPAAIWLLGSGLLGMAGIARRRAS
jgi:hypothetical protein